MKVRVLNPVVATAHGLKAEGVVNVDDSLAEALAAIGAVEKVEERKVERATAAPGEKRNVRIPKKA